MQSWYSRLRHCWSECYGLECSHPPNVLLTHPRTHTFTHNRDRSESDAVIASLREFIAQYEQEARVEQSRINALARSSAKKPASRSLSTFSSPLSSSSSSHSNRKRQQHMPMALQQHSITVRTSPQAPMSRASSRPMSQSEALQLERVAMAERLLGKNF